MALGLYEAGVIVHDPRLSPSPFGEHNVYYGKVTPVRQQGGRNYKRPIAFNLLCLRILDLETFAQMCNAHSSCLPE